MRDYCRIDDQEKAPGCHEVSQMLRDETAELYACGNRRDVDTRGRSYGGGTRLRFSPSRHLALRRRPVRPGTSSGRDDGRDRLREVATRRPILGPEISFAITPRDQHRLDRRQHAARAVSWLHYPELRESELRFAQRWPKLLRAHPIQALLQPSRRNLSHVRPDHSIPVGQRSTAEVCGRRRASSGRRRTAAAHGPEVELDRHFEVTARRFQIALRLRWRRPREHGELFRRTLHGRVVHGLGMVVYKSKPSM
mmetsp:Transcript_14054/g.38404  ORF Transcript_14054/g.38404 Transcript_14054/m.38404 type:complete len:252 (+) Transcript_14054:1093-1848(+)